MSDRAAAGEEPRAAGRTAAATRRKTAGRVADAALAHPAEVERRRLLLREPHMRPLATLSQRLRRETGQAVPDADPLDGGVAARVLILLETPGPSIGRTNFVSRDNATGTARNLRRFGAAAGLQREDTLIWNTVPFVIHAPGALNRAPRAGEIRAGVALLPALLKLLPQLRVVVLAGRVARAAGPLCREGQGGRGDGTVAAAGGGPGGGGPATGGGRWAEGGKPSPVVMEMPHPSPTIVCTSPAIPARITATLREAALILTRLDVAAAREKAV